MEKERAEQLAEIVKDETEKSLYQVYKILESEKERFHTEIENTVVTMLEELFEQQEQKVIGVIGKIVFVESLVNLLNMDYTYPIFIYGEKIYVDQYPQSYVLDAGMVYHPLETLKNKCLERTKRFVNYKISICEIEQEIFNYLPYYNMFLVNALREVFKKENATNIMAKLHKTDDFMVILGEMYELPYCITPTIVDGKPKE